MVFQHSVVLTVTGLTNCFFDYYIYGNSIIILSSLTVHVLEEKKSWAPNLEKATKCANAAKKLPAGLLRPSWLDLRLHQKKII